MNHSDKLGFSPSMEFLGRFMILVAAALIRNQAAQLKQDKKRPYLTHYALESFRIQEHRYLSMYSRRSADRPLPVLLKYYEEITISIGLV